MTQRKEGAQFFWHSLSLPFLQLENWTTWNVVNNECSKRILKFQKMKKYLHSLFDSFAFARHRFGTPGKELNILSQEEFHATGW
jgi:hypothetical protein